MKAIEIANQIASRYKIMSAQQDIARDKETVLAEAFLEALEENARLKIDCEETHNMCAEICREYPEEIARLKDVVADLIDGLDANGDERCGLTQEQWDTRVRVARETLKESEES